VRATSPVAVPAEEWRERVADLVDTGFCWLDFLTVIDRREQLDVLIRLVDPLTGQAELLQTSIPAGAAVLASVTGPLPGADWYEREAAEMFGMVFAGHPDPRPLLTRPGSGQPPLRKSTPLPARRTVPWPGAEPEHERASARRRAQPPGVLETWEDG
jgi:NADH:ubiquinone oxidoreductase subunit C